MKKTLLFLFINIFIIPIKAQDQVWVLGNGYKSSKSYENVVVDFYKTQYTFPPFIFKLAELDYNGFNFAANNSSITDSKGQIKVAYDGFFVSRIAYPDSTGREVYSDSLGVRKLTFENFTANGGTMQSTLLLPHHTLFEHYVLINTEQIAGKTRLYYSVINMDGTKNHGQGEIIVQRRLIDEGNYNRGGVTACRHGNGKDWWLMFRELQADSTMKIHRFIVEENGIKKITPQSTAYKTSVTLPSIRAHYSPDGKYIVYMQCASNKVFNLELFKFDRCKGEINPVPIKKYNFDVVENNYVGGMAFSPDSRYLYFSNGAKLIQYDVINNTDVLIASKEVTTGNCASGECIFHGMQLAPDGRIYIVSNQTNALSVIHEPNKKGAACNFKEKDLLLPVTLNNFVLPNHANYKLGKAECPVATSDKGNIENIRLFPNPGNDQITINVGDVELPEATRIIFYDAMGREVCSQKITNTLINCRTWSSGLYTYRITNTQQQAGKWVKM
jgi:hypothetical protein